MSVAISKIMVSPVVEAGDSQNVGEVRNLMDSLEISALPVVSTTGVLVGIVTADDLVIDYDDTLPVSRVMTSPVHTLEPDADVAEAAHLMRQHGHHHLVITDNGKVVGILSSLDLLGLIEIRGGVE